jgi:hypothetical protein
MGKGCTLLAMMFPKPIGNESDLARAYVSESLLPCSHPALSWSFKLRDRQGFSCCVLVDLRIVAESYWFVISSYTWSYINQKLIDCEGKEYQSLAVRRQVEIIRIDIQLQRRNLQ